MNEANAKSYLRARDEVFAEDLVKKFLEHYRFLKYNVARFSRRNHLGYQELYRSQNAILFEIEQHILRFDEVVTDSKLDNDFSNPLERKAKDEKWHDAKEKAELFGDVGALDLEEPEVETQFEKITQLNMKQQYILSYNALAPQKDNPGNNFYFYQPLKKYQNLLIDVDFRIAGVPFPGPLYNSISRDVTYLSYINNRDIAIIPTTGLPSSDPAQAAGENPLYVFAGGIGNARAVMIVPTEKVNYVNWTKKKDSSDYWVIGSVDGDSFYIPSLKVHQQNPPKALKGLAAEQKEVYFKVKTPLVNNPVNFTRFFSSETYAYRFYFKMGENIHVQFLEEGKKELKTFSLDAPADEEDFVKVLTETRIRPLHARLRFKTPKVADMDYNLILARNGLLFKVDKAEKTVAKKEKDFAVPLEGFRIVNLFLDESEATSSTDQKAVLYVLLRKAKVLQMARIIIKPGVVINDFVRYELGDTEFFGTSNRASFGVINQGATAKSVFIFFESTGMMARYNLKLEADGKTWKKDEARQDFLSNKDSVFINPELGFVHSVQWRRTKNTKNDSLLCTLCSKDEKVMSVFNLHAVQPGEISIGGMIYNKETGAYGVRDPQAPKEPKKTARQAHSSASQQQAGVMQSQVISANTSQGPAPTGQAAQQRPAQQLAQQPAQQQAQQTAQKPAQQPAQQQGQQSASNPNLGKSVGHSPWDDEED